MSDKMSSFLYIGDIVSLYAEGSVNGFISTLGCVDILSFVERFVTFPRLSEESGIRVEERHFIDERSKCGTETAAPCRDRLSGQRDASASLHRVFLKLSFSDVKFQKLVDDRCVVHPEAGDLANPPKKFRENPLVEQRCARVYVCQCVVFLRQEEELAYTRVREVYVSFCDPMGVLHDVWAAFGWDEASG
ncbi:hypothetical protein STEG23_033480 [Scotinomys teguina]